jgi:hypothetical protein
MTPRPKPPETFDENPALDADFFRRARPAAPGEAAHLRKALEATVRAHEVGAPLEKSLAEARAALMAER